MDIDKFHQLAPAITTLLQLGKGENSFLNSFVL